MFRDEISEGRGIQPASGYAEAPGKVRADSVVGPRLAGRYGIGLLSIGATQAVGFDLLGLHWDVMEDIPSADMLDKLF